MKLFHDVFVGNPVFFISSRLFSFFEFKHQLVNVFFFFPWFSLFIFFLFFLLSFILFLHRVYHYLLHSSIRRTFYLHFSKNYDTVLTRNKSRRFNFDTYFLFIQRTLWKKCVLSLGVMKYVYLETFVSQQMRRIHKERSSISTVKRFATPCFSMFYVVCLLLCLISCIMCSTSCSSGKSRTPTAVK